MRSQTTELKVTGIPTTCTASLNEIFTAILKHLKLERFSDDIFETSKFNLLNRSEINAQSNDDGNNKYRVTTFSFIVKFKSANVRDHVLKIKRESGILKVSDIFPSSSVSPIYLYEMVPSVLHKLRLLAMTRADKLNYKYVWIRGSKLFVRKDDETEKIQLTKESDLDRMI